MRKVVPIVLICMFAFGCATIALSKDRMEVKNALAKWKAAVLADDAPAALALYAADCRPAVYQDQTSLEETLAALLKRVKRDDGRIDLANATVILHAGHATVLPVAVATRTGTITLRLDLERRDGRWPITAMSRK